MAATLTAENELTRVSFPIMKAEDTAAVNPVDGTPDLVIVGKATDGTLDSDLQIVDPDASLRWIERWHKTKSNIRMAHDAQKPVGRGLEVDGHLVKALISDPTAKHLIRTKVLNDFSIGIMHPDIRVGDPRFKHLDPEGKAVKGVITDRQDGLSQLGEISVVDRGSNYGSSFQIAKAAADGAPEFTGKMLGGDDLTARTGEPDLVKASGVDPDTLIKASVTFSPADLGRLLEHRRAAEEREALKAAAGADEAAGDNAAEDEKDGDGDDADAGTQGGGAKSAAGPDAAAAAEPDATKGVLSAADRDAMAASDFAYVDSRGGKHLPVADEGHVHSALGRFAQQEFESPAARKRAARKILSRARALGIDVAGDADVAQAAKVAACPQCAQVNKSAASFCGKCGAPMKADKAAEPAAPEPGAAKAAEPAQAEPVPGGQVDVAVSLRHKAAGAPDGQAVLHDLICPAFAEGDIAKCFPGMTVASAASPELWQQKALDAAACAPLDEARAVQNLWQHAVTLKATEPDVMADVLADLRKSFAEAQTGPVSFPSPTEMSAQRYRRPLITAGHAASPPADGPSPSQVATGGMTASDYTRGPLTGDHAQPSPGNDQSPGLITPPAVAGRPERVFYRNTSRASARQAMQVLHDHIAETHPDLCPMHGPGYEGAAPISARPVPGAEGAPAARKGDGEPDAAKAAAGETSKPSIKPGKVPCPKCGKGNKPKAAFCGKCGAPMKADKAVDVAALQSALERQADGTSVMVLPPAIRTAEEPLVTTLTLDPAALKAAVAEAVAPLTAKLAEQQDLIDQMAAAPDPRYAPFKAVAAGGVLPKSAAPEPLTVEKAAQAAQLVVLAEMQHQAMHDPDPGQREAAWAAVNKMLGLPGSQPA